MTTPTPYPYQPPAPQPRNGLGTTGMITGIIGLLFSFIPGIGVIAWVLGPLGIIFGGVGLSQVNKGVADNRGMAIAGIATGVLAVVICFIWLIALSASYADPY